MVPAPGVPDLPQEVQHLALLQEVHPPVQLQDPVRPFLPAPPDLPAVLPEAAPTTGLRRAVLLPAVHLAAEVLQALTAIVLQGAARQAAVLQVPAATVHLEAAEVLLQAQAALHLAEAAGLPQEGHQEDKCFLIRKSQSYENS